MVGIQQYTVCGNRNYKKVFRPNWSKFSHDYADVILLSVEEETLA